MFLPTNQKNIKSEASNNQISLDFVFISKTQTHIYTIIRIGRVVVGETETHRNHKKT